MSYKTNKHRHSRLRQHAEQHTKLMSILAIVLFLAIVSLSGMTEGSHSPAARLFQHLTVFWHQAITTEG